MVFIHGGEIWERCKPSWLSACRGADMVVANSDYTRRRADHLHGGFAAARICWLGTETGSTQVHRAAPGGAKRVLIVGRMKHGDDYKGHRELIKAWPKVLASVGEVTLDIIGRGDLRQELERLAHRIGVEAYVQFRGFVTEAELDTAYAQATLFAMPSRGEGFGLVYIEAMRHGLPVIASIHDAAAEAVTNGETGLLVNLNEPDDLANKLIALLKDQTLARRMGEAGQMRWREHFTYSAFRSRFRNILREFFDSG